MSANGHEALPLKAEFAVRAEPNKLEGRRVGLAIDQNQIRADLTVAAIFPFAGERMAVKPLGQRKVGREQLNRLDSNLSSFLPRTPDFSRR